jgi:soluble lytic murein transglycosylase
MKRTAWFVGILLVIATTISFWWGRQTWLERSQDAPIRAAARRYGVDPALVKAVVWRESRFHPDVRGRAGELGLMQIQETAAGEWAEAEHISHFVHEHCLDPVTNTLAGTYYLAKVLRRYSKTDNPPAYALADYNAGRGNVLKWNNGAAATNCEAFLSQISFPSTKSYVLTVLERRERYRDSFK